MQPVSIMIKRGFAHLVNHLAKTLANDFNMEVIHIDDIGTPSIEGKIDLAHIEEVENLTEVIAVFRRKTVFRGLEPAKNTQ